MMLAAVPVGCAATNNPEHALDASRLADVALQDAVQRLRTSLVSSDFMARRDAGAEPATIETSIVENLTGDRLTQAEMWVLAVRLLTAGPIQETARKENVTFGVAANGRDMLQDAALAGPLAASIEPTHHMKMTFRAVPEDTARYYLEYRITRIRNRRHVWADSFTIQRDVVTAD